MGEQCIALGKQLRQMKIDNYKVYRMKPDGTVIFMHPADGVFPEKVNKGRVQVNGRPFTIRSNPQQSELKWTKYHMKSYEADPLTTLFVKARVQAFQDVPNLFALPQPNMDELVPVEEVDKYTKQEYTTRLMEALKRVQDDRKEKEKESLIIPTAIWKCYTTTVLLSKCQLLDDRKVPLLNWHFRIEFALTANSTWSCVDIQIARFGQVC